MPLELMPARLERFVELKRSAWLSTPILWAAKDVPAMPPAVSEPAQQCKTEIDRDLGTEVFPMPQLSFDGGAERDGSGIKWRYATQGLSNLRPPEMLTNADDEITGSQLHDSSSRSRDDATFARKSYIDGVVYMLKALPDDMDDLEKAAVRRAAAHSCKDREGEVGQTTTLPRRAAYRPSDGKKPLLHRCVQGLVATLVLLAHLLFYLFKEGLRIGARYERQYNISQVLVERGFVVAGALGQYSVGLRARINEMSESQVGHALGALTAWALETVIAGVQDGLGEGLQIINRRP